MAKSTSVNLDIDIETPWPSGDWEALAEHAADATASAAPELANTRLTTSILFTSDERVHQLNKEWRDRDKPTNVLSFPMLAREELLELAPAEDKQGPPEMLGDIALAFGTCTREAEEKSIPLEHHATHLIVHGLLHLAGYDHEISETDAEKMEAMEVAILAKLGIADPYTDS